MFRFIGNIILFIICWSFLSAILITLLGEEIPFITEFLPGIIIFYLIFLSKGAQQARSERKLKEYKKRAPYQVRRCSWCGNSFKMIDSGYEWHCSKRCYVNDR